ncbi:type IVB secretion system protein IcmH/DotU [Ideonella azotifigens]|uniref:Type IVB secretion system protein IcmH/DotU n=1 Tax=Ideonella azotifigens TaxID=513160 RepID=A0ABN1KI18_9BURK|nr:type IVB secretion system protein IcmH/DotU [Ideonella azotifigens]MCD2339626.1 type IVB secretion system protein IcmH/DotU [Ideonella azotifigens]
MSTAPSLFGAGQAPLTQSRSAVQAPGAEPRGLMDLLYPGFYMVFLLRNGHAPADAEVFRERVLSLLKQVDRGAKKLGLEAADVYRAKFAFCGLLDEIVLTSKLKIREAWVVKPLQLELFGEHMAGERFFERLEKLRGEGAVRVQVLEVYHMCLLLGFQGRYAMEGSEKLGYLTARLGDEIVHMQGRRAAFAPHWAPPDQISNKLRSEVPLWVMASVFAVIGLVAFLGLRTHLRNSTESTLAPYSQVVQLAPQSAWVTITLP